MILHDWKCATHGFFESDKPVCPHGCDMGISKVFLQPPSVGTGIVQAMDERMQRLADQHGMTNLRGGVHEGEAQKQAPATDSLAPQWRPFGSQSLSGLSRQAAVPVAAAAQAAGGRMGVAQKTHIIARADE